MGSQTFVEWFWFATEFDLLTWLEIWFNIPNEHIDKK